MPLIAKLILIVALMASVLLMVFMVAQLPDHSELADMVLIAIGSLLTIIGNLATSVANGRGERDVHKDTD